MSTKGTPVQRFRLCEELYEEVIEAIDRRNLWSVQEPWTFSEFIRTAVREKLDKMERSRKPRGRSVVSGVSGFVAKENT